MTNQANVVTTTLDLASVMKACQVLSSEIDLAKLLQSKERMEWGLGGGRRKGSRSLLLEGEGGEWKERRVERDAWASVMKVYHIRKKRWTRK